MRQQTIVFIHGAWVTGRCWEAYINFFESRGYTCVAPNWPYLDRPVAELRAAPASALAALGIEEIVAHYAAIIQQLAEPPVLIGHSFGGLFTQLLLDQGLGAAGVAISSAPPKGILPTPTAVKGSLPVLTTWQGWRQVLTMSEAHFGRYFANGIPERERASAYEAQVVPAPGRIFFQAATALFHNTLAVNYKKASRAPLLLIAGTQDKTVPAAMNQVNYKRYVNQSETITTFKTFERSHTIIMEPGWEEVANYTADWLARLPMHPVASSNATAASG